MQNKDLVLIGNSLIPLTGIRSVLSKVEHTRYFPFFRAKAVNYLEIRYICGTVYRLKYNNPDSLREDLLTLAEALDRVVNVESIYEEPETNDTSLGEEEKEA